MQLGVNVPNFGPGTDPGTLRAWARRAEGLGFGLLMVSDHVSVVPEVAVRYPEPFFEPFTALAWLAGATRTIRLGTTVLILPYRHPLLTARMAANLNELSGGRLVLGVGVGWAREEFAALGVPFERRGALTDAALEVLRDARASGVGAGVGGRGARGEGDRASDPVGGPPATPRFPVWVGGDSPAALRRAVAYGDAWHPLHPTLPALRAALARHPLPGLAPRLAFRLTDAPVHASDRPAGTGSVGQILYDLRELSAMGAHDVVLDPYSGDPEQTRDPEAAWQALATVTEAAVAAGVPGLELIPADPIPADPTFVHSTTSHPTPAHTGHSPRTSP